MTDDARDGDRTGELHAPTTMAVTPGGRQPGAALAWALWALTTLGLAATAWLDRLLRQADMPELTWLHLSGIPQVVAAVSAATVGAVLASRRPAHPVGWLLLGLGLSLTMWGLTFGYTRYGLVARPGALPAARYLAGLVNGVVMLWLSCAGFVLLLTPTGSLPSPRWRWWARVAAAAAAVWLLGSVVHPAPLYPEYPSIANPLAVPGLPRPLLDAAIPIAGVVVLVALVVAAGSLVVRFRRARGVERQQLRWLAYAAGLAAVALLVAMAALIGDFGSNLLDAALGVCAGLLPLATGAAILRYRLYDLDRIISRTVAYGLLTVLLGLGYAGLVLGLGQLLPQDSSLVVAGATLAVAGVFQAARRHVQDAVDRRFNRRRYDAAQTIAAFSSRLRDELDLDTLSAELLAVVEETMQPTRAWLWLRPPQAPAGPAGARRGPATKLRMQPAPSNMAGYPRRTCGLSPAVPLCVAIREARDCRRRRRGPKARQERGQAVESIARSASTRPGRSTPPEGGQSAAVFAADWPPSGP